MLPVIPPEAPFSAEQRAWLNGFFAGVFSRHPVGDDVSQKSHHGMGPSARIAFGSQTGTAESLAKKAARRLAREGVRVTTQPLGELDPGILTQDECLLIVTSTYGEGEMPDNAQAFWDRIRSADAPRFDGIRYAVLALGDSAYVDFCQAGRDLDARIEGLGGIRFHPRVDCDVDFESPFASWQEEIVQLISPKHRPIALTALAA